MPATGTATLNFGAAPGTNVVSASVTGQSAITAASHADAWLMGNSTADHNETEHLIVPMNIVCSNVQDGIGFDITASTEFRLTGTFTVHWVWA